MRTEAEAHFLEEIIDQQVIEECETNSACRPALEWVKAGPRTYAALRNKRLAWFEWLARFSTLAAVLEKLALDPEAFVREGVAGNPHTPKAVLEKLALDPDIFVRWKAAKNGLATAAVPF